jgi:hypothetical protein
VPLINDDASRSALPDRTDRYNPALRLVVVSCRSAYHRVDSNTLPGVRHHTDESKQVENRTTILIADPTRYQRIPRKTIARGIVVVKLTQTCCEECLSHDKLLEPTPDKGGFPY